MAQNKHVSIKNNRYVWHLSVFTDWRMCCGTSDFDDIQLYAHTNFCLWGFKAVCHEAPLSVDIMGLWLEDQCCWVQNLWCNKEIDSQVVVQAWLRDNIHVQITHVLVSVVVISALNWQLRWGQQHSVTSVLVVLFQCWGSSSSAKS